MDRCRTAAGLQRRAPFAEFPVADWDAFVAGNLSGVFYVSRFVAPGMVERGSGKFINIASVQSQLLKPILRCKENAFIQLHVATLTFTF